MLGFVRMAMILFLLIALMLATSILMLSRRNLAKRINNLSKTLDQVTAGDLTARVAVVRLMRWANWGKISTPCSINSSH